MKYTLEINGDALNRAISNLKKVKARSIYSVYIEIGTQCNLFFMNIHNTTPFYLKNQPLTIFFITKNAPHWRVFVLININELFTAGYPLQSLRLLQPCSLHTVCHSDGQQ